MGLVRLPDGGSLSIPRSRYWVLVEEIYTQEVYDRVLRPGRGDVVVDVGANIGVYTLRAARQVGDGGLVVAVEPFEESYDLLVKNIKLNGLENVIPLRCALSDRDGYCRLYLDGYLGIGNSIVRETDQWVRVRVRRFDSILESLGIGGVGFVKIDVEEAELRVLRGMANSLQSGVVSQLSIAAYHSREEPTRVRRYLERYGYSVRPVRIPKRHYATYVYARSLK